MEFPTVLAVEDDRPVLRFLMAAFAANGCTVSEADSAEPALELIRKEAFDLVVSDIRMPGLSGLDLLRAVKVRHPATPVVLITGAPSVDSAVFGLRHGAYDYLPKPFSIAQLEDLVERIRRDRREGRARVCPVALDEELARRQLGVEVLLRIGDLALGGCPPQRLFEAVLGYAMQSLRAAAAMIVLREEDGTFKTTRHGDARLLAELSTRLPTSFERLASTGGGEPLVLDGTPGVEVLAAVVPGLGDSVGVLCLARDAVQGAFLPDERELFLGCARTTGVALQKAVLRESLEGHLVDTIAAFVNAIESKDPHLKGHSARVALYAIELSVAMHLGDPEIMVLWRAGMLHDLGKLVMLDSIVRHPGELTTEEHEMIRTHPVIGGRIVEPLKFLAREAPAIRHHHERYDGSGYPDGLCGEQIPFVARVVAVANVFDAMTSDGPHRATRPLDVARAEILSMAGTRLDPRLATAFGTISLERLADISRGSQP